MLPLGVGINMQTLNDLKGIISLNNPHVYFIYSNNYRGNTLDLSILKF